jgi:hypothetical protein
VAFALHHGAGSAGGPRWRIMAPELGPQKSLFCREKRRGSAIRALLGAAMDSSGSGPSRRAQVLPQRGHGPRPPIKGVGFTGVRQGDDGPLLRTLEHACMQVKVRGSVIRALWGPGWTRLPQPAGFTAGISTARTGAWPSPVARQPLSSIGSPNGARPRGVRDRHHGHPSRSPGSCLFAGKNPWVSMIHVLWCPGWTFPEIFCRRKKYCRNGGMAFAHHHGAGVPGGPRWADHGPLSADPRNSRFAG